MTLTLTITNTDRLANNAPLHIALAGHGVTIGRSAQCDWSLPDPDKHISSRHCEVTFVAGSYVLTDLSTNGTMLNGSATRMAGPHSIERGDRIKVGHYEIIAILSEVALDAETMLDPDESFEAAASEPATDSQLDAPPARLAAQPSPAPSVSAVAAAPAHPLIDAFAAAAGLDAAQFKATDTETMERAGLVIRLLVSGLMTLVEARSRAKSEMGAEQTALSFDGNNPIKFARKPEQAVTQLLNPQERGFMDTAMAIEDAFTDLDAHQQATLRAMQGALRATLDRFSPTAIKARADTGGIRARLMPGARGAALWQAYEREFAGVAQGSDDAFMDVFAKEFRRAYTDLARQSDNRQANRQARKPRVGRPYLPSTDLYQTMSACQLWLAAVETNLLVQSGPRAV